MEKLILKSCFLVLALTLSACGQKEKEVSGLDTYMTVDGQFTQKDESAVDGTGTIRFTTTMPSISSDQSIEVKGSLNPGGSVAIVLNSDDLLLGNSKGVILKLTRSNDSFTAQPTGQISVEGATVGIANQRLAYITSLDFDIFVQIQNRPTSTRLLVWRKDLLNYVLVNADVDTSIPAHLTGPFPPGSGKGVFVGLKLTKARITAAQMGDPKVTLP